MCDIYGLRTVAMAGVIGGLLKKHHFKTYITGDDVITCFRT